METIGFMGILAVIIAAIIYFIPALIAFKSQKRNKASILVLNLFLGWSLIGWVISLVWALKEDER